MQFRGTVNVCLDKCRGVECSNGQVGFGKRRKREVKGDARSNKLFEISMSTFIKVDYEQNADKSVINETEENLKQLKIANQKLNRNSRENVFESIHDSRPENLQGGGDKAKVEETNVFTRVVETFETSAASTTVIGCAALVLSVLLSRFI